MAAKNKNKRTTRASGRKAKRSRSKPIPAPAKTGSVALAVLNADKLKELYATMVKCRMLEERVHALGIAGQTLGRREAVLVGAAAHLVAEDSIALAHSGFLASFIRGTPLKLIMAQPATKASASGHRAAEETLHGSPAQLSMATGLALAHAMKVSANVALVFPGDDAAALALIHDGLALAAKHSLPLVCLTECSSLAEPSSFGPGTTASGAAPQDGSPAPHVPKIIVDGIDVVAIFRVAQEAVRRARSGHGPSLIECFIPGENCDYAAPRRSNDEPREPIAFMAQYLKRRNLWSDEWQQKIVDDFGCELDEAALAEPPSVSERPFDHVYSLDGENTRPSPIATLLGRTRPSGG